MSSTAARRGAAEADERALAERVEERFVNEAVEDERLEDEVNNRLFFRLFQASNLYERQAQKVLRISAVQGAILGALSRDVRRGMPLSELVDYLAVSRQNLDGVLKRLEKLRYVERVEDAGNRRIRIVKLTPAGLRAWRSLFARTLAFYRLGTRKVGLRERMAFVETLGRINRAMKAIDAPERDADLGSTCKAKPKARATA